VTTGYEWEERADSATAIISISGNRANRHFLGGLADSRSPADGDYIQVRILHSQINQQCFLSIGLLDDGLWDSRHVTRLGG